MDQRQRWTYFEELRPKVPEVIAFIESIPIEKCRDLDFLEHEFIPKLGLNDEALHEQPPELSEYFGKGLHLWQYPNQLSRYLAWLSANTNEVRAYMEIGCRWGGMFILIAEWLRKFSKNFQKVIAIDPIGKTPMLDAYFTHLHKLGIATLFLKSFSTAPEVRKAVDSERPDFVFIDGDHTLEGALRDHLLARKHANIVVHHDIFSNPCPGTTFLWTALKQFEADKFEPMEFIQQYDSVSGNFLGIGVLKRLPTAATLNRIPWGTEVASSVTAHLSLI